MLVGARGRLLCLAVVAVVAAVSAPEVASACSRDPGPPPDGTIRRVTALRLDSKAPLAIPKDGGVVFAIVAGAMTDEEILARVKVTATEQATGAAINGVLIRARETENRWVYRLPTATQLEPKFLPVGPLDITVRVLGIINATTEVDQRAPIADKPFTVVVEDRLLVIPKFPLETSVATNVVSDEAAPMIKCNDTVPNSCGNFAGPKPTRYKRVPKIELRTQTTSDPFLKQTMRFFSRNKQGGRSPEIIDPFVTETGFQNLEKPDAEYCATLTTTSLMDPSRSETVESCTPHPATLDLSMSDAEQHDQVMSTLRECPNPEFPPGHTASDPSGTRENADGCSVTQTTRRQPASWLGPAVAAAVSLWLARRRRTQTRLS